MQLKFDLLMTSNKIKYVEHKDFLEVILQGERDYFDLAKIWESLFDKCDTLKLNKIFIVSQMTGSLSLTQYYNILDKIRSKRIILKYKIAGIFDQSAKEEIKKFDKVISQNEGWNVRLFHDYDEAKEWLLK